MNKHSFKQLHSFLLLWGSQTVSQLGTAMTDYAVIIWVYSRKGTERRAAHGVAVSQFFVGEGWMSISKAQALGIVFRSADTYAQELENRNLLFICVDMKSMRFPPQAVIDFIPTRYRQLLLKQF